MNDIQKHIGEAKLLVSMMAHPNYQNDRGGHLENLNRLKWILNRIESTEVELFHIVPVLGEVQSELTRALSLFPRRLASMHEGYAVVLEEVDELWDEIKKNDKKRDLSKVRVEAIQAAAMLVRLVMELLPKTAAKAEAAGVYVGFPRTATI